MRMNRQHMTVVIPSALVAFFIASAEPQIENARGLHGAWGLSAASVALSQSAGKTVNVKEFGAKANGQEDDTRAVQTAIDAAKTGDTIFFPAGVYMVSNLTVSNRSGLSFRGDGHTSVIRQNRGAARLATIDKSRDIVISNLAFDVNGTASFGGVAFYSVTGVRIENNSFVDSAPAPVKSMDRFSFVFGRGSVPSRNIQILNNVIEDLQLEVNHSQRVVIARNTVKRAVKTAGIGIFSVKEGAIAEDYQITNNTIIDSLGAGISVGIDPPTDSDCIFRRITIADNRVIRTNTSDYGLRIGTGDNSKQTVGNVFENIEIKNNRFQTESGAPQPVQTIFANTSERAGIVFRGLSIIGNTIENKGPTGTGSAIELRRVQKSLVVANNVKGVANGITLAGDLLSNELRNNIVETSGIAYVLEGSLGGNKAVNNRIVGKPREGWKLSGLQTSDSIKE